MPAILSNEDRRKWLGEEPTTTAEFKAMLGTVEGVNWQVMKEPPKPKASKTESARSKAPEEPGPF
jgi:hypothetical protein